MSDAPSPDEPFVRPYMITTGRTVGAGGDLPIETMVLAQQSPEGLDDDHLEILVMCDDPISIAEIAAHRAVPVGVARVLVADLTASGHLDVYDTAAAGDAAIVRRLLDGIRAL